MSDTKLTGWKMVPTDMTDAMRQAAAGWSDYPDACYAAALLAANLVHMELFGFVDADGLFYSTITGEPPKPGCTPAYRAIK